ncbi:MAG: hypothetical protein QXR09_02720 [Candidatus Aenigmatarchaeota archaeon]
MLFGRKKEEVKREEVQENEEIKLPTIDEIKQQLGKIEVQEKALPVPKVEESPVQVRMEKKELEKRTRIEELKKSVPLFIKLERYEEILSMIEELRTLLSLIKNSFSVLDESEKIKSEIIETIKENVKKMEEKVASLDSKLLKPTGYEEMEERIEYKSKEMEDALSTLKSQIDKLKQEIQSLE